MLQLLRFLLDVRCQDWEQVEVFCVHSVKLHAKGVTDPINFKSGSQIGSSSLLLLLEFAEEGIMLLFQKLVFLLWEHEV